MKNPINLSHVGKTSMQLTHMVKGKSNMGIVFDFMSVNEAIISAVNTIIKVRKFRCSRPK